MARYGPNDRCQEGNNTSDDQDIEHEGLAVREPLLERLNELGLRPLLRRSPALLCPGLTSYHGAAYLVHEDRRCLCTGYRGATSAYCSKCDEPATPLSFRAANCP